MVLSKEERSTIMQDVAKKVWKDRKRKYGVTGFILSKEKRSEKISEGVSKVGMSEKLKSYYEAQKDNPSQDELDRRKKIKKAMTGRDITWSDKISKSMTGEKNPMFGKEGELHHNFEKDLGKVHSKNCSKGIQEKIKQEGFHWGMSGKQHSLESNRKNRESCIKYIEQTKLQGMPLIPRLGTNEKEILDRLEKEFGHKILRQFKIASYFIDGYIPEIKLAIEVDEEHHNRQKESDLRRQKEIENLLDCKFVRTMGVNPELKEDG